MLVLLSTEVDRYCARQFGITNAAPLIELLAQRFGVPKFSEQYHTELLRLNAYFDRAYGVRTGWIDLRNVESRFYNPTKVSVLWNLVSPVYYNRSEAEAAVAKFFELLDNATEPELARYGRTRLLPPEAQWEEMTLASNPRERHFIYCARNQIEARTMIDGVMTSLALGSYYHDHSEFPDTLETLIPRYLPRVPIDHFAKRPMRYERDGRRYRLYSVWRDHIDTNGEVIVPPNEARHRGDYRFGVWQVSE